MSAAELLDQIQRLPAPERRWLVGKLVHGSEETAAVEEKEWANFPGNQLLAEYASEDSIYDQD